MNISDKKQIVWEKKDFPWKKSFYWHFFINCLTSFWIILLVFWVIFQKLNSLLLSHVWKVYPLQDKTLPTVKISFHLHTAIDQSHNSYKDVLRTNEKPVGIFEKKMDNTHHFLLMKSPKSKKIKLPANLQVIII